MVAAPTGVTYAHQCGGVAADLREVEGFAVPLGGTEAAGPLHAFFPCVQEAAPPHGERWSEEQIARLRAIIGAIPFWHTNRHGQRDSCGFLALDMTRLDNLTEAWIPVLTPYGPGILVCDNSD